MRNAPKFLGPWERIDRLVDDLAADALAEIKLMAAAALDALPPLPGRDVALDYTFADLARNVAMWPPEWHRQGMRAMSEDEMVEMGRRQMEASRPSPHPWHGGIGGSAFFASYPFGR